MLTYTLKPIVSHTLQSTHPFCQRQNKSKIKQCYFFLFPTLSTQLNFNHTKLLTKKGHLLSLSQNIDQAEEHRDCQYGISTALCPFTFSFPHLVPMFQVTLFLHNNSFVSSAES